MMTKPHPIQNLSRHLKAIVNATTNRIRDIMVEHDALAPSERNSTRAKAIREELRWLYRVLRPALDEATHDFNALCIIIKMGMGE